MMKNKKMMMMDMMNKPAKKSMPKKTAKKAMPKKTGKKK